jgi:hypothetical protein
MPSKEQPQDRKKDRELVRNYLKCIYQSVNDSENPAELAENLFRLTMLMSNRKEVRGKVEAILRQVKSMQSDMEKEMTQSISQSFEVPREKLLQHLQSQFFRIIKRNSINVPRSFKLRTGPRPAFIKYVQDAYKNEKKQLPTTSTQLRTFAKNSSVRIMPEERFLQISAGIQNIKVVYALLTSDQVLFMCYDTNRGNYFVEEKNG